jgi:HlyD family secretion protein
MPFPLYFSCTTPRGAGRPLPIILVAMVAASVLTIAVLLAQSGGTAGQLLHNAPGGSSQPAPAPGVATAVVEPREFVRTIRIHGAVEAVRSFTASAPRLAGPGNNTLIITQLAVPGTLVRQGDLLVEFDSQEQVKNALERRAEYLDLEEQIKQKRAEHLAARARDESALQQAERAVERARLETLANDLIAPIQAEKNNLAHEEAQARLAQLRQTNALKARAAGAEIRILEIQRDRARNAMRHAEENARQMRATAPLGGLVVMKTTWKGGQMGEFQEGEEARAGVPVLQVVDPSAMQVRMRVNQTEVQELRPGQPVTVSIDAYPELSFPGRIEQVAPLGLASALAPRVRSFVALASIDGTDPKLTPDLSAAVDIEVERLSNVLTVPRDAIRTDGDRTFVLLRRGSRSEERQVRVGALSDLEVVIESGLERGAVVERSFSSHASSGSPR